ncbi:MAG: glycoside hydrolase family 16 protein [Herminiimonas sp.]|nr:glycoside hydrolase family 16 protein [Herminiimonas sp.]
MKNPLRACKTLFSLTVAAMFLTACGGGSSDSGTASSVGSTSSSGLPGNQLAATMSLGHKLPALATKPVGNQYLAEVFTSDSGALTVADAPAGQDAANYRLTFNESFDAPLDTRVWNTGRTGGVNATNNYHTSDGALQIWPERGADGNHFDRTIDTEGHFSQQYGYFEIEAKLPKGKGVWPAFWLINQTGEKRPEIDILEAYASGEAPWSAPGANGIPSATMYAPVVWNDADSRAGYGKIATPDLAEGFHKYGVKWEPNRVTFYFDGVERYAVDASLTGPMYVILDLWFGSASGSPDGSTPTGASNSFTINYVKAWQFR